MKVQPYFPEPVSVPDNVAEKPYAVRLAFIRKVVGWHLASAAAVACVVAFVPSPLSPLACVLALAASLLFLSAERQLARSPRGDDMLSLLVLPAVVLFLGWCLRAAERAGVAVWPLGVAVLFGALYTMLCGRDFSFTGRFALCLMATIAAVLGAAATSLLDWGQVPSSIVCCAALQFFLDYDLAALLRRRRVDQVPAAVADLYRDVLNFLSYSVRVAQHWRRFRFF